MRTNGQEKAHTTQCKVYSTRAELWEKMTRCEGKALVNVFEKPDLQKGICNLIVQIKSAKWDNGSVSGAYSRASGLAEQKHVDHARRVNLSYSKAPAMPTWASTIIP